MQTKKELPDGRFVFAAEKDFVQIKNLWQEAFDDDEEYIDSFLSYYFNERRIILFKNGEKVLSMASLFSIEFNGRKAVYVFALATKNEFKGKGIATELLDYIQTVFECAVILQPEMNGVEKFYKNIGFELLEADKLYSVCEKFKITELTLGRFDGFIREYKKPETDKMFFTETEPKNIEKITEYFNLRPNKSCESTPLCLYLYHRLFTPLYCIVDDTCFIIYTQNNKITGAALPLCKENKLAKNFKIQEKFFTEKLKIKHRIFSGNSEGFEALKNSGVLDNYESSEHPVYKDYLYSGESMRTLAGKKLSKKRNLIHQFEKNYDGRWEYVSLGFEDKNTILDFVEQWYESHPSDDPFLTVEHNGLIDVVSHREMFSIFKFGGIKIDGELKAFSIGSYNSYENMAVIDVEKADPQINGLYQLINREFLLHEFPNAEIVNREDDVGEENLRKAKMSYNPIGFEIKYNITQK